MKYFDKNFFRFLLVFICLIAAGIFFLVYAEAHASELINVNTASQAELETLSGIGPTKAQAIIDYRTNNGPFLTIEDLQKVTGIGTVTFSNIKDFITVGSVSSSAALTNEVSTSTSYNGSSSFSAPDPELRISIGGDRTAAVGMKVELRASSNISQATLQWNFGDGTVMYGSVASHTYQFPGKYIVVLRASYSGKLAKARMIINVSDDAVSISSASPERIELINRGSTEVDLSNRTIYFGDKKFTFPEESMIGAGQKISFASETTHLTPANLDEVTMVNPDTTKMYRPAIAKNKKVTVSSSLTSINLAQVSTSTLSTSTVNVFQTSREKRGFWTTMKHFFQL